ncbi:pseudouridine synthase family protein isoform X2 [Wolffia australiana]
MRGACLLPPFPPPQPSRQRLPSLRHLLPSSPLYKPPLNNRLNFKSLFSLSSSSSLSSLSEAMVKPLEEADVGISCYISPLSGFRGILKHRYADFIVNEVDCDGNVVRLTSFDFPEEVAEVVVDERSASDFDYSEKIEMFRSISGDADAALLSEFLERVSSGDVREDDFVLLSPDEDKSHRTEVHKFFKENLKLLITDVVKVPPGNSKAVRVRFSGGRGGGARKGSRKRKGRDDNNPSEDQRFDSRGSKTWPENLGKFLRFHLYKENKDTQEALGVIAKMLGVQVTVFKQQAKKLALLNDRLIGIKVGDFCHVEEGLVLGKLSGNRFTIVLRGVVADCDDTIRAAADSLGKNGFINYFGLQRFGSGSVPTHLVGAALLRGEWKAAVGLILDPRVGERPEIREGREYFKQSGDAEGTLKKLPHYLVAERALLQCLKKCPGNYLQALKAIPRTLRMMYVHSYQSYLWNHAASLRVQRYGIDQVVLGDLVYCKGAPVRLPNPDPVEVRDLNGGVTDEGEEDDDIIASENARPVKILDAGDLSQGEYTLADVVLPLPGSSVHYPENDVARIYQEVAEKDGIKLNKTVHTAKEFSITSLKGGYRHVFHRPSDFTWELLSYTDEDKSLSETDLEIISGKSLEFSEKNYTCNLEESEQAAAPPARKALKLGFTLSASCYATMAIRELMKSSTSTAFHKSL